MSSRYFKNESCEFFPCHKCDTEYFNCLFCYCPLYSLGDKCGGNFEILPDGIKSCEKCMIPHKKNGYDIIMKNIDKVVQNVKEHNKKK